MKIVYLFRSLAIMGGAEKIIIDKMNYFADNFHYDISVITYEQGEHPIVYPLSSKVKHINLNFPFYKLYKYNILKRAWLFLKMKYDFQKTVKEQINLIKPEITICTTYSYIDISTILGLHDKSYKIIESHSAKRSIGKADNFKVNGFKKLLASIFDYYYFKMISKCTALITLTHNDAKEWKNLKSIVVIPNMLNYYPEKIRQLSENKRIITAGRLVKQKGYDLLIDAWKTVHEKYPEWILDIYGEGEDRNTLLEHININQLEKSIIIHEPTTDIYNKYMESSIYVMSSRWEGFGLVLAEAMSCGIPCISFDCPHGPSDIITEGEDGLLVENGNVKQLAKKIGHLIEREDLRKQMGEKARENIKKFLPSNVMPQWSELFQKLLENKPK